VVEGLGVLAHGLGEGRTAFEPPRTRR
jgi:hypothetical protein